MNSPTYKLEYSNQALKQLRKLNQTTARRLVLWLDRNVANKRNPRLSGQALTGEMNGCWRYRVGDYRIIVLIRDKELVILCLSIGHRKEIYR